jgi:hypothetical protein
MTSIVLPLGSLAPARSVEAMARHAPYFVTFVSSVVNALLRRGAYSQ